MGAALPWIIGAQAAGGAIARSGAGGDIAEFSRDVFMTEEEKAAQERSKAQAELFGLVGPRISEILSTGVPEDVSQRIMGRGQEVARRQSQALGSGFQQAGMAFGTTHAGAEGQLRGDIARQTQETLSDLELRLQTGMIAPILGMQAPESGIPGWLEMAQGTALLAPMLGGESYG